MQSFSFPPEFIFGVADADLQVIGEEACVREEGAQPTMWSFFAAAGRTALLERYGGEKGSVPAAVVAELNFYTESIEKATQKKTRLAVEVDQLLKSQQSSVFQLRDEALVSLVSRRPSKEGKVDRVLALWGAAHDLAPRSRRIMPRILTTR